jgi:GntR family transcriptional regulator of arabinose operon
MLDPSNPSPKYSQLKEHLKELIRDGELSPGEKLPSENDLARRFKLSRHTVRQALGELENEGFIYREQGRGTFCRQNPKTVRPNIAVLTTYISDYIFPAIIKGIEEVFSSEGYNLILASTNNDPVKEAQCLENLISQDIVALIVEPTQSAQPSSNLHYFHKLETRGIPYVMIHACYPELDPAYLVMDDERGGYLATQYLLQLGHRRIAGIFKSDDMQGVQRRQGFLAALAEYQLLPNPNWIGSYKTGQIHSYPFEFSRSLLTQDPRPTAIVCYNDQIALEVLEAIRHAGLKVPQDISLIGYDDSLLASASEVKLTTFKHPKAEMGRQAARFVIDMLNGRIAKPSLTYPPELIIRSSCQTL